MCVQFYQETLETEEQPVAAKVKLEKVDAEAEEPRNSPPQATLNEETKAVEDGTEADSARNEDGGDAREKVDLVDELSSHSTDNGPKPRGVLVIHSQMKNRVKKSLQWRADEELESHHFFELDETERVNVNKLQFVDMKQAERERERQTFQMSKHMGTFSFTKHR